MTKEQAEKEIRDNFSKVWTDGIIKELEQKPCDAVDRQAVMYYIQTQPKANDVP